MTLEKNFESPLHCKEIKLVNFKGNQRWLFTGRAIAEAEAPIVWPSDVKSQLIWKDPAGKGWRQKEKAEAKDKIDRITNSVDMNLSKLGEIVEDRGAWHITVHGVTESQTRLNDSTTTVQESELQCPSGNSITFVFKELVIKHRSELKVTFVSHYCSVLAAQWLIDPWRWMLIKTFLRKGTRISLKGRCECHRETFQFLRFCFYFFTVSDLPSSFSLSFFLAKLSLCS